MLYILPLRPEGLSIEINDDTDFNSLEFLKKGSYFYVNLIPNKNGIVEIPPQNMLRFLFFFF